jgi:catechol 2,3-dioxygenase-like lactoylglutathione lyase family enzyme
LDRAIGFYTGVLGMKVLRDRSTRKYNWLCRLAIVAEAVLNPLTTAA